jgi:hypothetical protein
MMAESLQPSSEMMCTDASFHPDEARRHVGDPPLDLAARPLLSQHDRASIIVTDDVEGILTDINPDYADRLSCWCKHGVLLVWLPLTSLALAE